LGRPRAERPALRQGESVEESIDDDWINGFESIGAEASSGCGLVDFCAQVLILVDECLAGLLERSDVRDGDVRGGVSLSLGKRPSEIEPSGGPGNGRIQQIEDTAPQAFGGCFEVCEHDLLDAALAGVGCDQMVDVHVLLLTNAVQAPHTLLQPY
jgi:hypothetical protein